VVEVSGAKEIAEDLTRAMKLRKKWVQTWDKIGARILRMPEWMQNIILEDINTAILNRIAVMELVQRSRKVDA
jgi:hypothetical protein